MCGSAGFTDVPPVRSPRTPRLVACSASATLTVLIFVRGVSRFHFAPGPRNYAADRHVVLMELHVVTNIGLTQYTAAPPLRGLWNDPRPASPVSSAVQRSPRQRRGLCMQPCVLSRGFKMRALLLGVGDAP